MHQTTEDELRRPTGAEWKRTKMWARKGAGPIVLHWCRPFHASILGLVIGNRTAWLTCQQCLTRISSLSCSFASLRACKLIRATCKVRTVVVSCGFYPFVAIIYGSHCTCTCERRRKTCCASFFSSSNRKKRHAGNASFCSLSSAFRQIGIQLMVTLVGRTPS